MTPSSALALLLPDGTVTNTLMAPNPPYRRPDGPLPSRDVFAAAHVIPRIGGDNTPGAPADIDWDQTLQFRHHLWSWGLGVADAMDTAQRNMGLDPRAVRELVTRSAREAHTVGGRLVVGINTDDIDDHVADLSRVVDAYVAQLHHAEDVGATPVLMASRHLAKAATGSEDYRRVYADVLRRAGGPVILHWLGAAFDAQLEGYFGETFDEASDTVLSIINDNRDQIAGIKMSLLDDEAERATRRRLPDGIRMYTGDDYHYVDLIAGDGDRHSDALLGAFAALGPLAATAIQALPDTASFRTLLGPSEALARLIFERPTWHYKTGIAFLSWLNGHQQAFTMVGGMHSARSLPHLSEIVRLANATGALEQPELAQERWHALLAVHGVNIRSARGAVPIGNAELVL